MKPFMKLKLFRDRLLADNTFLNKVAIEVVIGGAMQLIAEYQNRGKAFVQEFDFVVAGIATCVLANFFTLYLAAPTLVPKAVGASTNAVAKFFKTCPDNAFQTVLKGTPAPSIVQRCGGIFKPMPELFFIGFVAASGGYLYTALNVAVRKFLNPKSEGGADLDALQIGKIGVAVGAYVAVSSNLRYQFMAGVLEQRVLDVALASKVSLRTAGSTVIRTSNTYLGSYLLVAYLRWLGVQKMADGDAKGA
eukprot:CAMPEP_0173454530 /NCGR_PEP_ID=MMETSP1357-20121228/52596_1 /TAXON_ID=77926 /ORGANISM="Hemiselmis rufescens, Strain PCC563" /LENGTH=247 /DNA_ID=CAMNT_0014421565 /DNA_START=1 /DNA_END=740 /DNA_ORIENTATION=+